jgi:hypothetical protein
VPDAPGIGELARKIEDFRRDVRDDFSQLTTRMDAFVLREVYLADKASLELRLSRMEREQEASRGAVRAAIYAAVGSVIASISAGIVLALLLRGGK